MKFYTGVVYELRTCMEGDICAEKYHGEITIREIIISAGILCELTHHSSLLLLKEKKKNIRKPHQ